MKPKSELILCQTEDNRTRIEVRLENETVWLSLNQMAELFQTTKQNVSLHIQNIYAEGELRREATVKEYLTVQNVRTAWYINPSGDALRFVTAHTLPKL